MIFLLLIFVLAFWRRSVELKASFRDPTKGKGKRAPKGTLLRRILPERKQSRIRSVPRGDSTLRSLLPKSRPLETQSRSYTKAPLRVPGLHGGASPKTPMTNQKVTLGIPAFLAEWPPPRKHMTSLNPRRGQTFCPSSSSPKPNSSLVTMFFIILD